MKELRLVVSLRTWFVPAILATLGVACHGESEADVHGSAGTSSTTHADSGGSGAVGGRTNGANPGVGASSGSLGSGVTGGGTSTTGGSTSNSGTAVSTTATTVRTGQVIAMNTHQPNITPSLSVMFRESSRAQGTCEPPQVFDDCTFYPTCEEDWTSTYVSAGSVTLTSTEPAMSVTLEPGSDNEYRIGSGSFRPGFSGGETAHITASGATIPAFATDISIPLTLLIDSPVPDASGMITASATSDLVLEFSRGTAGVELFLQSSQSTGSLTCQAKTQTGTMTIRKEALSVIGSTHAQLWTFGYETITAGDWLITVGSLMEAYTPDKSHYVTITVE